MGRWLHVAALEYSSECASELSESFVPEGFGEGLVGGCDRIGMIRNTMKARLQKQVTASGTFQFFVGMGWG